MLDLLFGPFVLLGIERVTMTPTPGFSLDSIDWSHPVARSPVWSALFAARHLATSPWLSAT